ncbi:thioredoxin domain-containing protein [Cellulomonas fimi]|uniref:Thioredoxin domain-containing protein n=1 Tax=Cellulomonas fimi TaxID=1708 RepID=A0A7Y0LZ80_CELFI|nr:thioredoxin domain-containing protein [Cellulomonas fimi]NMR19432.1 thioredoxin domain-containing protein [Cellulomonas fimi]
MTNRLAASTSPYLLQHAENPVDWFEWGDEAFAEAERRDVPLLISVGYAACHWCHVMAHESFEDEATASYMNEHFVNVKVDREERPDVDAVYMEATQATTGAGGWPMTVFATPEGEPFYCGTYFPPRPAHGMPSFPQVLAAIAAAWAERRAEVTASAAGLRQALADRPGTLLGTDPGAPREHRVEESLAAISRDFDATRGGFGGAPKFPPSMVLEWLLRHHARTGDTDALTMATSTLEAMARGGMVDQLGGGFARYSVDATWTVPHFEKMLYDNALLLRAYTHWWRATGDPLARRVAQETADWMLRDLRTPEGGFASSLDADSDGHEGTYYVWTPAQLREVLGSDDGAWAAELFGVTDVGTFERGTSVLQLRADPGADEHERFASVRRRLLAARHRRTPPARDDKVVAGWNGLAIGALAEAGALLDRSDWVDAASASAGLLADLHVRTMSAASPRSDGRHPADGPTVRLARTSRAGTVGRSPGVLEDYANLADGLLVLAAVTADHRWTGLAGRLLDAAMTRFRDEAGTFFDTAEDETDPVLARMRRPRDPADGPTPSGPAAVAGALVAWGALTGSEDHREAAEQSLDELLAIAVRYPRAAGTALAVAEALADGPREVAVVGPLDDPATRSLQAAALRGTAPGAVVAVADPVDLAAHGAPVALLADRPLVGGRPTAYVCRGFVCGLPTTDPVELARGLGALTPATGP